MSSQQRPQSPPADPPYAGPLGVTRREAVLVPGADGAPRRAEVARQVNALTDPLLARQALEGTLHRVHDHDLAVPFVYHDPASRRFALVIPAARAHEEFALRAELLTRLAGDPSEVLPGYVREARAVVGPAGLRRYLEEGARGAVTAPDPRAEAAQRALEQREEKLHRLAQEVTRREDELAAAQNELAEREAELDRRAAELAEREHAVADEERVMRANMAALGAREHRLDAREAELDARARALDARSAVDLDDDAVTRRPPAVGDGGDRLSREVARDERMEVDVTDLAPVPKPSADVVNVDPSELVPAGMSVLPDARPTPSPRPPDVAEDRARWAARGDRAYAAVVEGEVRVWFQGTPEVAAQLAESSAVPVLQAEPDGRFPLALLSLRGDGGAPVYSRVALDITRPEDRAVVESLARDFRVRAEVVSPLGRALGSTALGAPSEQNAQRVLELLTRRAPGTHDEHHAALERLLREGVHAGADDASLPLTDDHALSTAAGVEAALAAYEPLLDRARLDRFVVARGVALPQVESFGRRLCLAALRCGVVPSAAFVRRALELGIAPDERALAVRALTAYARTVEGGAATIGRTPASASRAWAPLLAWAARAGASVPDAARAAVASLYDPDDPASVPPPDHRTAPPPEALASMGDGELAGWVDHPEVRLAAARELARRDPARHEAAVARALRMLPSAQVAELAAELVRGGDALGDVWVELLASRRRTVAAVAAAGAGVLKTRRALTPLVQRALAKDNPDWRLAAWAAGEFGAAAVRAVARADTDQTERLAWVLGHAVRAGAARELERARAESSKSFQEAATRALALQDEIRAWDEALRKGDGEIERLVRPVVARALGAEGAAKSPQDTRAS